jgi:predicted ATP-dependent endonuclease of OLD family
MEAGFEFPVENASAGVYEILVLTFAAVANAGSVVLLDEPATNLHPAKQREVLRILADRSRKSNAQLMIVTHSPYFVHARYLRGLFRFNLESGETAIHPLDRRGVSDFDSLARTIERFPKVIPMLFANKVVLFEGGTEEAALPVWFQKLQPSLDFAHLGIEMTAVDGHGGFKSYAPLLHSLSIPFLMIGDAKAKPLVSGYKAHAALFDKPNFADVIEDERPGALKKVLKRIPNRNRAGSPEVCREVALGSTPPPSVVRVWTAIRGFFE